eukprot:4877522-Prorocentrum_lima.AAC.1
MPGSLIPLEAAGRPGPCRATPSANARCGEAGSAFGSNGASGPRKCAGFATRVGARDGRTTWGA